ncbi:MAG: hypothetical protein AAF696_16255, partial [Bacteroidota bacterium]
STSFIIDHLFKFHSFGFSWRNLELIPEIITINKAPQLRLFIQSLIEQYSKTFIRPTTGGVFQYKFYNKSSNEIKYISKISELSSAAFNFTLDESLYIKRHYYKKLASLKRNYQLFSSSPEGNTYINSVGFIHMILGDLHFYDKEYDDAIVQYTDGMQLLRNKNDEELTEHQTILLIEKKLKLGLTLEKIQSYNSAYTLYGGLIDEIPKWIAKFSPPKPSSDSLASVYDEEAQKESSQFKTLKLLSQPFVAFLHILEKLWRGGITDFDLRKSENQLLENLKQAEREIIYAPDPTQANEDELGKDSSKIDNTYLFQLLLSNYYGNVGSILYFKNKNFSCLIGKLKNYSMTFRRILEKNSIEGPKESYKASENNQAFWKYLNILCTADRRDYNPSLSAYINYMESIRWFLVRYNDELEPIREFIKNEKSQRERYQGVLSVKRNGEITIINPFLFDLLIILTGPFPRTLNSRHLYALGNLLSKLGDSIIAIVSERLNIPLNEKMFRFLFEEGGQPKMKLEERFSKAFKLIREELYGLPFSHNGIPLSNHKRRISYPFSLNLAIFTFRLAAEFYRKSGKPYSYGFQYKKVLHVSKEYLSIKTRQSPRWDQNDFAFQDTFVSFLKQHIAVEIIKAITWENDTANRPQILKYKDIFRLQRRMNSDNMQAIYTNVSTSSEVWEVILLVSEIQMKLVKEGKIPIKDLDLGLSYQTYAPFITSGSQFVKLLEYKYKAELNFLFFREWGFEKLLESFMGKNGVKAKEGICPIDGYRNFLFDTWETLPGKGSPTSPPINKESIFDRIKESFSQLQKEEYLTQDLFIIDVLEYLITDSIYGLAELVKILNIYGINYMTNNSLLGFAHIKLAKWSSYFRTLLRIQEGKDPDKQIFQKLEKLLGWDFLYYLDVRYHYDLALKYYYYALQMHREGEGYKKMVSHMYFLEDDLNDNLYHFCAAMERYNINTGNLREIINKLKKEIEGTPDGKLEGSKLYKYEAYIGKLEEQGPASSSPPPSPKKPLTL